MPPRWLQVVAEALTITGSIGVVTGKFNLQDLYRRVGYGKEVLSRCVGVGGWVWRWVGVAGGGGEALRKCGDWVRWRRLLCATAVPGCTLRCLGVAGYCASAPCPLPHAFGFVSPPLRLFTVVWTGR